MQGMGERPGGDPYAYLLAARAADVSTRRRRVIVVGAGMAGLGAAEALAGSGLEVLVLEASDRVGGRVWGERFGGLAADLGAMFVEGTSRDNPMVRLMERYGLAQRRQPRRRVCFDQGQRLGRAEAIEASQALRSGLEPLSSCGGTGEPNNCYSHLDALAAADQALDGGLPDPYPADGALASSSRVRRLSNELRGKELYYGAGLGDLSARWFGYDEDFGGSHSPIEGGYHAIPALLARGLADAPNVQICLNTRVMKVRSEQGDGMSVECERCTHRADYVIVTCSLGRLLAGTGN